RGVHTETQRRPHEQRGARIAADADADRDRRHPWPAIVVDLAEHRDAKIHRAFLIVLAYDNARRLTAHIAQGEHRIDKAGGDEPARERHVPPSLRLRTSGYGMGAAYQNASDDNERSTNRRHEDAQWALVTHSVNRFFVRTIP